MSVRPDPESFKPSFGARPQATGWARVAPAIAAARRYGIGGLIILILAQVFLPEAWKPTAVMGVAAGLSVKKDIETKSATEIAYAKGMADAQAQAQAQAAQQIELSRQQLAARTDALQTQATASNVADAACIAGSIISSMAQGDRTWQTTGNTMKSACGLGAVFRQNIAREQSEVVGTTGTLRTWQAGTPPAAQPAQPAEAVPASSLGRPVIMPMRH